MSEFDDIVKANTSENGTEWLFECSMCCALADIAGEFKADLADAIGLLRELSALTPANDDLATYASSLASGRRFYWKCPVCRTQQERESEDAPYLCTNPTCPAVKARALINRTDADSATVQREDEG